MIQFETNASVAGQLAARGASFEARLRRAAMVLTLMVGVPLVLVWFGLIGWGVFWARAERAGTVGDRPHALTAPNARGTTGPARPRVAGAWARCQEQGPQPSARRPAMLSIDLNSDLGEGFGDYRCGDDAAMLEVVTSANVACGLHAGDPEIMARTFAIARERGVAVGAHPGYPDRWGFGRRVLPFTPGEVERLVAYQVGAAAGLAAYAGHRLTYVKAHGALANLAAVERPVADAIARAVKAVDPSLSLLAIALTARKSRPARHRGSTYTRRSSPTAATPRPGS